MTLRQYLEARGRRDKWIMIAALVPCAATLVSGSRYALVGPAAIIVLAILMNIFAMGIRCPRCQASLGRLGYCYFAALTSRARGYYMQRAEDLGKCPHCGLRLDEEIGKQ